MDKIEEILDKHLEIGSVDKFNAVFNELTTLIQEEEEKTVRAILQLVNKELKKQGIKDTDATDIVFSYWSERKQNEK